jgi:hypothetical protein
MYFGLLFSSCVNAETAEQWQFSITPVLWNASVKASLNDGSGGGGGDQPINPDYHFFTLDNLSDYMSLQLEAKRGRFSLLFDSLRARYQDERAGRLKNLNVSTKLGFVELAAAYQFSDKSKLDFIAGARRTFLEINVDLASASTGLIPAINKQSSSSWTDPIIGLRYNYSIAENWQLWLRGDVGGFGVGTQRSINAIANVQYFINKYVSFAAGYRYLAIDFKEEDVLHDVRLKGVQLGLGIHF